ncbi:hypothetical protein ACQSSU_12685 [Micromonospora echinospora]
MTAPMGCEGLPKLPPPPPPPMPGPRFNPETGLIEVPLTGCCGDLPDRCLCGEFFAELAAAPVLHMTAGRAAA